MKHRLAQLRERLTRLPDTPHRVAAAFAFGVFLGFSPFLGFQVVLGLGLGTLLRLSRVAIFLGTWVNLPWITPLYYVLATELGARLLGTEPPSRLGEDIRALVSQASLSFGTLERSVTLLRPMVWPFVVGSTLGGFVLGIVAYSGMLVVLRSRTRSEQGAV
jgi:uncharacterized protein (DUF2062 family)